jgi:Mce-associated membrane protein
LTSSADPRRAAPAQANPRKRVAGARRRPQSGTTPTYGASATTSSASTPAASGPIAFAGTSTATATLERPAVDPVHDEEPRADESGLGRDLPHEDESVVQEPPREAVQEATARRSRRLWIPAVAVVTALALLAAALVYALRPTVSDSDRTAAVGSARTTLESLLSYSGSSFDKHVDEVLPQLASPFKDQFTKVAATDIKPMAVKNEATVQAKVYEAGVMDASGDGGEGTTVRVMAFVNQATTTKAQPAPAIDQNRVIATMRKTGDRWLVSDLSAY